MFKIWAKVMKGDKIIKQCVYEKADKFAYSKFFTYLAEICEELDICTPILLKTHIFNYAKFNLTQFTKRDFAESIPFDKLVLNNVVV